VCEEFAWHDDDDGDDDDDDQNAPHKQHVLNPH
jgi:hypothetical protein